MNMTRAIIRALRGDPEVVNEMLRERIEIEEGPLSTVVQAAGALEPILARAVGRKPSKLGKWSLKSAHLLANLATEDKHTNEIFARVAKGSTVGIVFVDVAGFTTFTAENGDEAALEMLACLEELIDRMLNVTKGEVVKRLGDGYLLVFPSASQAVRGALMLRDDVKKQRTKNPGLRVRVAVHAGEPLIEGNDLLGHDVNLAARLLDHCQPGHVIVSDAAKDRAERRLQKIDFGKRRQIKIRGLTTRVGAHSL